MSGQTQPETALQALAEKLRTDAIAIFGEGQAERDIIEWFYGALLAAAPATPAAQGFRDGVASVANSEIPNNQDASAAQSAPAGERDSYWFSLVMNCAAELETASYCMTDTEAKRVAQSGANYYRERAGAALAASTGQRQGETQSRERWTAVCGHWQDTTLAIHGERTGHIASGIDEDAAHAIVKAHNEGLPPIAAASSGQEVKP